MTKSTFKWLIGIIIALIVLNVASIGFIVFKTMNVSTGNTQQFTGGQSSSMDRPFPDMMMRRLNYSDEQRAQLTNEFRAHRRDMQVLNDSLQHIRRQLFLMNRSGDSSSTDERRALYDRSGEIHSEMTRLQDEHIHSLMNISNPQQQEQLRTWLQRMGQRHMSGARDGMMHRERHGRN